MESPHEIDSITTVRSHTDGIGMLLESVSQGDSRAEFQLWNLLSERLHQVASRKLFSRQSLFDEDDVASIVFAKLCIRLRERRVPTFASLHQLRCYLDRCVEHAIIDLMRYAGTLRRGRDAQFCRDTDLCQLQGQTTVTVAIELNEQFDAFAANLPQNERLLFQGIRVGLSKDHLSAILDCSTRTVERKLRQLRGRLKRHLQQSR